jgi:serine/threonine-protein kinase
VSLFSEFKERHLFRIVAAYAAAGWIAVSGVDQLVDREVLPRFVYLIALVWYVGGFLAAVIIGWYHGEKGAQKATTNEIALLSGIGLVAVIVSGSIIQSSMARAADGAAGLEGNLDIRRVAVMYFDDRSRDESLQFVADGLTETLIEQLAQVQGIDVVSANGSARFRDSDALPDSIGRALDAGTVVEGTVRPDGERIRVDLSLSDGISGAEFRSATFERSAEELTGLQEELGVEVSRLLRAWLGEELSVRTTAAETESSAAWALFQRGERERKQAEEARREGRVEEFWAGLARADSLFAQAADLDSEWARPWVMRAEVSRRRAQGSAGDPLEADEFIQEGLLQAERALGVDVQAAGAYEKRGMLRYIRWALSLETDPARADQLLASAQEDLERAVQIEPGRANTWNVLSIIHAQNLDPIEAKLAARRAYEEDAFLDVADHLVYGLYLSSYDLEQFPDAVSYCREGRERFPEDPRFYDCELWLLASRALEPDVERAWALADTIAMLTPDQEREWKRLESTLAVGGVLARAGMADSARAVFDLVQSNPEVDPSGELLTTQAVFRIQMGEQDEAIELIKRYLLSNPEHREGWGWSSHWWWRPLQDNPEFRDLVGG